MGYKKYNIRHTMGYKKYNIRHTMGYKKNNKKLHDAVLFTLVGIRCIGWRLMVMSCVCWCRSLQMFILASLGCLDFTFKQKINFKVDFNFNF